MKKIFCFLVLFISIKAFSQSPVAWAFSAKKLGDLQYEIRMTASISGNWHLYSQTTPEGGPVPTQISFNKNPIVVLDNGVEEEGKLHTKHEEVFGIDTKYYAGEVVFVQKLKLKAKSKTALSGTVEYMVCNDSQCLPPTKQAFTIALQ